MNLPTRPANNNDPRERERLLAQYAGIFPHNIKEFGEVYAKKVIKKSKNYSR